MNEENEQQTEKGRKAGELSEQKTTSKSNIRGTK